LDIGFSTVEGCCLGAGIRACFLALDNAIPKKDEKDDTVYVNMAFSRNSTWLEVISYHPYEGRIDIFVHDDENIANINNIKNVMVRIPSWVNKEEIQVSINDKLISADFENIFIKLSKIKKGDYIKIEYPLALNSKSETVNGTEYSVEWKGDTVIGINPKGEMYPIFERDCMKDNTAPMLDRQPYKHQTGGSAFW
jgi:hypothetical protein